MSASAGPDRSRVAVGQIDAAVGQADVVDDARQLPSAESARRMDCSTRSQRRAVSSMRVPVGARRCSLNWPLSTEGKKSCPSQGTRAPPERRTKTRSTPPETLADGAGSVPAGAGNARASARSLLRTAFAGAPEDCCSTPGCAWPLAHDRAADTSPWSAPAFATADRTPASRTPRPRPAAQTDTAQRRSERTSARTRCRCTASKQTPERRSAARHPESPAAISLPMRDVAVDVFDFDRGVVHQNADRQRQSAQRHDVDGLAQRAQHDDRRQNRQRNRNRDDQRAAPASQEEQNHQPGQAGGDDGFPDHAVDRCAHEDRLVGQRRDAQFRRQRWPGSAASSCLDAG